MSQQLRLTPLNDAHVSLNARMVDFAGWNMPVMYSGILDEVRAVRNNVGIFDISHMGRVNISGIGATALLQKLTSNDVAALEFSQAQYSLLMNESGGIIDDIIVYRKSEEAYLVIINASNTDKDLTWIRSHAPTAVTIDDITLSTAMIAVQGPAAPSLVAKLASDPSLVDIGRFHYTAGVIAGAQATFCRTGYTGEDGFEIIVPVAVAVEVWQDLISAGAVPCGLGSRDALRIEAGYPLYGHEIDDTTSPVEALLMWAVSMEKGPFIGSDRVAAIKAEGPSRKLMGVVSRERIQPRQGYTVFVGSEAVGEITSGVFSPTLGHSVAMAYISSKYAKTGIEIEVGIRDKRISATLKQKKNLLHTS